MVGVTLAAIAAIAGGVALATLHGDVARNGRAEETAGASASADAGRHGGTLRAASGADGVSEDPTAKRAIALNGSNPVADEIFSRRMPAFVVALGKTVDEPALVADGGSDDAASGSERGTKAVDDASPEGKLALAENALAGEDVNTALGAAPAKALGEVLRAAKAAARSDADGEKTAIDLEIATARLDEALLDAGLPYFVDSSVRVVRASGKHLVLLYEFGVVGTSVYVGAGPNARVRTVRLRRLDNLNWRHTLLGMVRPHRAQAVVLLDQLDRELVELLLPTLAPKAPFSLLASDDVDDAAEPSTTTTATVSGTPSVGTSIAERAGVDLRKELSALADVDPTMARQLGEGLRARARLFKTWDERAKARNFRISPPTKLALDVDAVRKELGDTIPKGEWDELVRVQKSLDTPAISSTYHALRDAFAASIERHEVQHRLDLLHPLPVPKSIDVLVPPDPTAKSSDGPLTTPRSPGERLRERIRSELSAYLSQIGRDDGMPKTTYHRLLKMLLDPQVRGGAESYVALLVTEELARELAVPDVTPIFHDGKIDDERVERAERAISAAPANVVCAAAKRAWRRTFGALLPPLTVRDGSKADHP